MAGHGGWLAVSLRVQRLGFSFVPELAASPDSEGGQDQLPQADEDDQSGPGQAVHDGRGEQHGCRKGPEIAHYCEYPAQNAHCSILTFFVGRRGHHSRSLRARAWPITLNPPMAWAVHTAQRMLG